jgi:protein-S-isoprenylcysteine O-methyltransferase Ste14
VVIGYALLWPAWSGLVWVGLYLAIAHVMVRTEEEHLQRAYGEAYERYCAGTPRYLGWSG